MHTHSSVSKCQDISRKEVISVKEQAQKHQCKGLYMIPVQDSLEEYKKKLGGMRVQVRFWTKKLLEPENEDQKLD